MGKRRQRGDGAQKPDRDGDAPPDTDRAPSNGVRVSDRPGANNRPAELEAAYDQLAALAANLNGAATLLTWLGRMLRPMLSESDPKLDADGISQVVDAVDSLRGGVCEAREHLRKMHDEFMLLKSRFVGAPSRTVSLSTIMGGLASLDDSALGVLAKLVMHLSARATGRMGA